VSTPFFHQIPSSLAVLSWHVITSFPLRRSRLGAHCPRRNSSPFIRRPPRIPFIHSSPSPYVLKSFSCQHFFFRFFPQFFWHDSFHLFSPTLPPHSQFQSCAASFLGALFGPPIKCSICAWSFCRVQVLLLALYSCRENSSNPSPPACEPPPPNTLDFILGWICLGPVNNTSRV